VSADINKAISCFEWGVRITVRAKPGTSRQRGLKIVDIGDDRCALEVSVSDVARDGKANKAIIDRIAQELGISKKQVAIKSGESSKIKIVDVSGDTIKIMKSLPF